MWTAVGGWGVFVSRLGSMVLLVTVQVLEACCMSVTLINVKLCETIMEGGTLGVEALHHGVDDMEM